MTDRFFLLDRAGIGFQLFTSAELRDATAEKAVAACIISEYWSNEVFSICGLTGAATATIMLPRQR